ncbi:MAG TPA: hypothetical protein VN739_02025 [Nitrososphaerales archaeon]|nr:hypothetical protein [Nitrososphaerales archaeon]
MESDSSASSANQAASEQEDASFDSYTVKVSRMKGWRLAGELATQLENFDDLKSEIGNDAEASQDKTLELKNTSRRIEIVTKENSKRKKY